MRKNSDFFSRPFQSLYTGLPGEGRCSKRVINRGISAPEQIYHVRVKNKW